MRIVGVEVEKRETLSHILAVLERFMREGVLTQATPKVCYDVRSSTVRISKRYSMRRNFSVYESFENLLLLASYALTFDLW